MSVFQNANHFQYGFSDVHRKGGKGGHTQMNDYSEECLWGVLKEKADTEREENSLPVVVRDLIVSLQHTGIRDSPPSIWHGSYTEQTGGVGIPTKFREGVRRGSSPLLEGTPSFSSCFYIKKKNCPPSQKAVI